MAAERGSVRAMAALVGPDRPPELEYLYGWHCELALARDYDMNGPKLVNYPTIAAWAGMTGREPNHLEVAALFVCDGALLHPGEVA